MNKILGTTNSDSLIGGAGDDFITGGFGNDSIFGGAGDDRISGDFGDDVLYGGGEEGDLTSIYSIGGRDTLLGGFGNDFYAVSSTTSGGSEIQDVILAAEPDSIDLLFIIAPNTDVESFINNLSDPNAFSEIAQDPDTYGDSAIELSLPQEGIVGLQKSGTNLIIDINRDGVAEAENDLTIIDYFDEQGNLGGGSIFLINNLVDRQQEIVDLFSEQSTSNVPEENLGTTVYRFFNDDTGVHFYTANEIERETVEDLTNFSFEGASYQAVDPLTGNPEPEPVYRFLNEDTGVHLYTISEVEKNAVEELDNFSFEGEAFFAYESEIEGSIPIYRFFNSTIGAHFHTPSEGERDNVEENLPDFQSEGIAYYVLPLEAGTEL